MWGVARPHNSILLPQSVRNISFLRQSWQFVWSLTESWVECMCAECISELYKIIRNRYYYSKYLCIMYLLYINKIVNFNFNCNLPYPMLQSISHIVRPINFNSNSFHLISQYIIHLKSTISIFYILGRIYS